MLNDADIVNQARQARGIVTINGVRVPFISFNVENTTHYHADTFRLTLACQALPAGLQAEDLLTLPLLTVEIFVGFPANALQYSSAELQSLILGRVDMLEYDPVQNVLELSGRDYSSVFIDAKTTEKWSNKRVADIVSTLAARHQMQAQIGDASGFAGNAYHIDQVRLAQQRSEWDVLTWLASETGYVVYVRGQTLYFVPPADESARTAYLINWLPATHTRAAQANAQSLSLSRNMSLAKGVQVTVSSHHFKTNQPYSVSVPAVAPGSAGATPAGEVQVYRYTIPGLTPEQARARAQSLYRQLMAHEMSIEVSLPGDNVLTTDNPVSLVGLNGGADQLYYPDTIRRSLSLDEGYTMSFTAKNVSAQAAAGMGEG